jgi:hypothetical protein
VEESLTPFSDGPVNQRLLAATTLAQDSAHDLNGHLLTILGFAELLQEEDAESGREGGYGAVLVRAAQHLQARIDALLYVLTAAARPPRAPRPQPLGGLLREVCVGPHATIDCRVPDERAVAVDAQGLRCLLRALLVISDPPLTITLALRPDPTDTGEWLEVACVAGTPHGEAPSGSTPVERTAEVAVIEGVATAMGGTCVARPAAPGGCDLCVSIPLPTSEQLTSQEGAD